MGERPEMSNMWEREDTLEHKTSIRQEEPGRTRNQIYEEMNPEIPNVRF